MMAASLLEGSPIPTTWVASESLLYSTKWMGQCVSHDAKASVDQVSLLALSVRLASFRTIALSLISLLLRGKARIASMGLGMTMESGFLKIATSGRKCPHNAVKIS